MKAITEPLPASLTHALAQLGVITQRETVNRAHIAWKPTAQDKEPPW